MSTPISQQPLLILPISSRQLWTTNIPSSSKPEMKKKTLSQVGQIIHGYLLFSLQNIIWNTRTQANQGGTQCPNIFFSSCFLFPQILKDFFTLVSLSAEKVRGSVWFPMPFAPLPSPGTQLGTWQDLPPRGSIEWHSLS